MTFLRRASRRICIPVLLATGALISPAAALAHNIAGTDAAFVAATRGADFWPFAYLGAKHMVTGYDHLLFLLGVIFFLSRMRDIALYVSLFSLGHSLTLLAGVFFHLDANPFLVDAVIGLSVAYKAFDNLQGFRTLFGSEPSPRLAVFGFGLIHGLGLATKLQALDLNSDGLLANLISFNIGVEAGQIVALSLMLVVITLWRSAPRFGGSAKAANVVLMAAGFTLAGQQLAGYFLNGATQ